MPVDHRICFVGDSFVQGAGDPQCLGWAGRVTATARARGYDLSHYNLGIRGDTSSDVLDRWQQECRIRLPSTTQDYLLFSFGVNDTVLENGERRVPVEASVACFRHILSDAQSQYQTAFIGPPPVNDAVQNQRIQELCGNFQSAARTVGVPYLPVYAALQQDTVWMQEVSVGDGSHPGAAGYERLSQLVLGADFWWFKG